MTKDSTSSGTHAESEDILFECPQCGKSLEIDARGAGYLIVCPDCQNEIQVPSWDDLVAGSASDEPAEEKPEKEATQDLVVQLQQRISELEKLHRADELCFKRLGDEITLIQAALDRITEIVEDRSAR